MQWTLPYCLLYFYPPPSHLVHVQLCTVYNMTVTFEISSLCDTWNPSNLIPCVCGMTQNQNNYRSLWTKMLPMWKHYFTKMFLAIFLLVYVLKTKPKVLWILKSGLSWLNDWLIEWLIDWLIVCCFSSRSRIFHSYRESPFPMKGRSKVNINHLLLRHTLFQSNYGTTKQDVLRCLASATHRLAGYYYNVPPYVQPNGYDLFVVSHTYMPGFTQDFVVHIWFINSPVVYRQELYYIFTKFTYIYIIIFPCDWYFKNLTSLKPDN